ncbi:hypothetical protein RUND412_011542 [Rhizina undulata]
MGNNQSGLNPENITFGIEVELVAAGFKSTSIPENVRPSEHILHDMALRLTDAGLKAEVWTLRGRPSYRSQRPSYRKWVVTDDASIQYDKDTIAGLFPRDGAPAPWQLEQLNHGGVEIVSPVFRVIPPQYWKGQISHLFKTLEENYHIRFNQSTGLHVHVGYGDGKIPLPILQNIAAVLVLFEPIIDKFHPGHRGVTAPNPHINSNGNSASLRGLTNLEVVEMISQCTKVIDLQKIMNDCTDQPRNHARRYKYNFMSLTDIGTIEFRQHAGTGNVEAVQMWILFCTSLVRRAAGTSQEYIVLMARRKDLGLLDLELFVGAGEADLMQYYRAKFSNELI